MYNFTHGSYTFYKDLQWGKKTGDFDGIGTSETFTLAIN